MLIVIFHFSVSAVVDLCIFDQEEQGYCKGVHWHKFREHRVSLLLLEAVKRQEDQ